MAAVTICSDFEAQKNSLTLFPLFPHLFPMKWWDWMPWSSFSEYWALSQLFNSPLSLSSRGFFTFIKRTSRCPCPSPTPRVYPNSGPSSRWFHPAISSIVFSILSFCLFILFMGFSRQEYWSGLPFPSPVDHILSDLSSITRPSWVVPHGMA